MSSISVTGESEEFDIVEEEENEPKFNLGLYMGCRNEAKQRHGRGWAILPNGDQYDGQYRKGKRHGFGLYVWVGGHRYYGQYHCGNRSGRGMFIYPDGTIYEGGWRKSQRHGKGRYHYDNGDNYTGDWYYGKRHGVGIYTFKSTTGCPPIRFKGTWVDDVRIGPFQVHFGMEDRCMVLHGSWEYGFPIGPAVFTFDQSYMVMGFFQGPDKNKTELNEDEGDESSVNNDLENMYATAPLWLAQDVCPYDYSLLPQEPVPLPLSDSDISVCTPTTAASVRSIEKEILCMDEGEEEGEEGEMECVECPYECSSNVDSSSEPCRPHGDPCAIEIMKATKCDPPTTI